VAVPIDQKITVDLYDCPVYVTAARGPTYVFTAGLKTRELPLKWILAGVAALMEIEE
jgi:dynein heavy chain